MKRTPFKIKPRKPLKRSRIRVVGHSTVSEQKREIQNLLRQVVIARDKGCILRKVRNCGGEIGQAVLQADHLLPRSNSATYADSRLVVCLCRPCHGGFKEWHKEEYDTMMKTILPKDIVELWDRCQKDSWRPIRTSSQDWKLSIIALKQELKLLTNNHEK